MSFLFFFLPSAHRPRSASSPLRSPTGPRTGVGAAGGSTGASVSGRGYPPKPNPLKPGFGSRGFQGDCKVAAGGLWQGSCVLGGARRCPCPEGSSPCSAVSGRGQRARLERWFLPHGLWQDEGGLSAGGRLGTRGWVTREAESAAESNGLAASRRGAGGRGRPGRRGRGRPRRGPQGAPGARCRVRRGGGGAGSARAGAPAPPAFEPGQSRGGERGRGKRQAVTSEPAQRIRWESRRSGAGE